MKSSFSLLIVTFLTLSSAVSALAASRSMLLECEGLEFVEGHPNFSNIEDYFPIRMKVKRLASEGAVIQGDFAEEGEVFSADGQTKIDFTDGDQVSVFTFDQAEYTALIEGETRTLEGVYEDGFYWSNGYNTRARFTVRCSPK